MTTIRNASFAAGLSIVCTLAAAAGLSAAQQPAASAPPPTCVAYLEGFKAKTESNYAGFVLEIKGARRVEYDRLFARLRNQALRTELNDCFPVLRTYVDWFDDPHLFVFQDTRDTTGADERRRTVRRRAASEAAVRQDLQRRAPSLDPIEGIWTDGRLRVAIIPAGPRRFEAVVLTPDSSSWSVGDVRAEIVKTAKGYDATLTGREYSRRVLAGDVSKRVLLRFAPEMLAKEYPVRAEDIGLVDLRDPRRPTLMVREGTVIVSMTSHSPAYRGVLDSLVRTHAATLRQSPRLIIDLRGNEGGSAGTSNSLLTYVLSAHQRPERFPERGGAVMLSSPDQINYARRSFGSDTSRFVRTLLERLTASPGRLVPFVEPGQERPVDRPDSLVHGPARVAVLVDRMTVSAAEVIVLRALRSTRATVFGQPTWGALDYQSTYFVRPFPGAPRWFLGYPTITRDTLLPLDGMRGKGIPPQVPLDWKTLVDPITYIDAYLRRQ